MVTRTCDGTDTNLTRVVTNGEFNANTMTRSIWDGMNAMVVDPKKYVVICCQCGRTFDDAERVVIYPHNPVPRKD